MADFSVHDILCIYTVVLLSGCLPVLDFRPYKIGQNIMKGMSIPEGAKPHVYESVFILEKNGEKKEFTLDNYPDSTCTFVDTRTILKEKDTSLRSTTSP